MQRKRKQKFLKNGDCDRTNSRTELIVESQDINSKSQLENVCSRRTTKRFSEFIIFATADCM